MFGTAFLLGAVVVFALGGRFLESSGLALAVTAVIGGLYLAGALELLALRRATASLDRALAGLSGAAAGPVQVLNDWLIRVHPSLHQPVRQRLEGHRGPMPGPLMTPYLVSLLVMLGILGTFVGLLQTLSGVTLGLEGAADLEAIRRALTVPVGGLGLMFGTSIAGVAASAMLGLMSALSRRDRVLVTRRLDQEIGAGLRPFSLVHQRQETFRALQVQSECLPDIANQLLRVASQLERMGDRLGDQLLANQERFQDSVQGHYGELAASVDQSLRDSLARTDQMLANGSRLVGEAIQPILRDTLTAISAELSRTLQGTREQLGRTMREQLQALGDGFAHTSAAVASAWREGLNAHQHANQALTEGLAASLDGFRAEFGRLSGELVGSIDRTNASWSERQVASLQALGTEVAGLFAEVTQQVRQSSEHALERQRDLTAALDQATQAAGQAARDGSARLLSEMSRLLSASEGLVQARMETEQGWLDGHQQRLGQIATSLREQFDLLRDEEARRGEAAVERMATLESRVADHLARLGQGLEEPMTRLIEVASATPRAAADVIGQLRQQMSNQLAEDNRLLEERARLMAELEAAGAALARTSQGQLAAIEQLVDRSGARLRAISEQFTGRVGAEMAKVSETADQFTVSAVELASLGESFALAVNLYSDSNRQLMDSLHRIEGALAASSTRSDEQLGYYVAQAREMIDYSLASQREIFDELRQLRPAAAVAREPSEVN